MMTFSNIFNYKVLILISLLLFSLNSLQADHRPPVDDIAPRRIPFDVDGHQLEIPYDGNRSLADINDNVIRAVVVIHGGSRTAGGSFRSILDPAEEADGADRTTFILAPQFLREIDIDVHELPNNMLFWSTRSWVQGNESKSTIANPRPALISSFAVIDTILLRLAERNPNLRTIVLAGHSGGGQFVNRYAAGSQMEQTLSAEFGINFRYIIANPRSYMYFNEERPVDGTVDQFAVPPGTDCPEYNDYRYGLDNLNSYMGNVGVTQIEEQYQEREVRYLLGEDDNEFLNLCCEAVLQGRHRLERGIAYYHHIARHFGSQIHNLHRLAIIANVAHSQSGIYASQCGMFFLFDFGNCNSESSADLSLTNTDSPDPVSEQSNLTYTLTVTNNGPDSATGVVLTDTLPATVTFDSATPSQGSCSGTSTVTCNLGNLTNGASATVTIVVTPTAVGDLSNTASVVGSEIDPKGNNTANAVTTVNVQQFTLTVTKAGSADGTVTSSPAGISCGSDCTEAYDSGRIVTLTATPDAGSVFSGWNGGGCSGTGTCMLTMNADTTVTATYSKVFTDDPLTSQVTLVKAVHITELRETINTLRSNNGLGAFSFTDSALTAGVTQVRAVHITDLRTALDGVYDALALTRPTYTDPAIVAGTTVIKAAHIEEIRSAVRDVE